MSIDKKTPPPVTVPASSGIALGMAAGIPVGLCFYACAAGPVLIGLFVALVGSIAVPITACVFGPRYFVAGMAYSAGVAGSSVVESLVVSQNLRYGGERQRYSPLCFWPSAFQYSSPRVSVRFKVGGRKSSAKARVALVARLTMRCSRPRQPCLVCQGKKVCEAAAAAELWR